MKQPLVPLVRVIRVGKSKYKTKQKTKPLQRFNYCRLSTRACSIDVCACRVTVTEVSHVD